MAVIYENVLCTLFPVVGLMTEATKDRGINNKYSYKQNILAENPYFYLSYKYKQNKTITKSSKTIAKNPLNNFSYIQNETSFVVRKPASNLCN